ncbi:MAG: single-stranded-DNA-specific exonuclease RecJ [Planctomycetes bacterium]|nr:single-stranded-DNA-specific exonuclease RecJ [Planctomycetota bacterium]
MPLVWNVRDRDLEASHELGRRLGVSSVTAQILLNRGLGDPDEAARFLAPDLLSLGEPEEMAGMVAAAERIHRAVSSRERIVVFGDYDVDGVSASSILVSLLSRLGATVESYLPDRATEGYGLSRAAVERIATKGASLVVTVDCGIRSVAEAERAAELGLDLVVTDHHIPGPELPRAFAVVNPRRPDCPYPFKHLCGAGIAFKLAWALARRVSGKARVDPELRDFLVEALTFAAVATIADVLPLVGENRVIAAFGLKRLARPANPGLAALVEIAGIGRNGPPTAQDVGFGIAPRINAAGRMGHASRALELFLTTDPARAREIAVELDRANRERQREERGIFEEAIERIAPGDLERERAIVLASETWHRGVIGIVAGRLAERFRRPVVLVALSDGLGRGSARSIPAYHLCDALDRVGEHMESHGGHAGAAGLEIRADRLDRFRVAFLSDARERIRPEDMAAELDIDLECPLAAVDRRLLAEMERLAPFGEGNPTPVFVTPDLSVAGLPRRMGDRGQHLSFVVRQGDASLRAVAFNRGDLYPEFAEGRSTFSLAYTPVLNRFRGSESVELHMEDVSFP